MARMRPVVGSETPRSSTLAVASSDICSLAAHDRTHPCHSNRRVGIYSLRVANRGMVTLHRETPPRPGPHPHRSARASFGPHINSINSSLDSSSRKSGIITTHHSTTTNIASSEITVDTSSRMDLPPAVAEPSGLSVEWADSVDNRSMDESVLQISGVGHRFLEEWIGNHSLDFLVDSGSAVKALSCSFYQTLVRAGALVGTLQTTSRKLWGANGSSIDILGCSSCVVSFLGLQTEFPILVCDSSTDAIIGRIH